MRTFLAVDIGASSGRHIFGWMEDGIFHMEEIYRFDNGLVNIGGRACWDAGRLFQEILRGMKKCRDMGRIPESMGIDTWAVDFALLDSDGQLLGPVVGYRDNRTAGMDAKVYEKIPEGELYRRTGIQKQIFNTIYQLMAVKEQTPELLEKAKTLLLVPDYFHFLLTGKMCCEYTNATTTQLVNVQTKDWDWEFIEKCGYPKNIFPKIAQPGHVLGNLTEEIQKIVGFDCQVVLPATHDTGSAVLAMPCREDTGLYISSGTWSLMGTEVKEAICTQEARAANLTNEGGYEFRFRFLKNIMGLWMIQCVRHEEKDAWSFAQLCQMAEENRDFPSRVDVNDGRFLAPESMEEAVRDYCRSTGQEVPETIGEMASVIYQSLGQSYSETLAQLEGICQRSFDCIHIIGGGSNADYLNQVTANVSGKTVVAGPTEATAIGNLLVQMIHGQIFPDLKAGRECIFKSFPIKIFNPEQSKGE